MGYLQKRIQEFVQGTDFEFFSYYGGGAQHSSGPENSLKPGYFTNPGGGLNPHSPLPLNTTLVICIKINVNTYQGCL